MRDPLQLVALLHDVEHIVFRASVGGKVHEQDIRDGERLLPQIKAELQHWPKPLDRCCDDGRAVEHFFAEPAPRGEAGQWHDEWAAVVRWSEALAWMRERAAGLDEKSDALVGAKCPTAAAMCRGKGDGLSIALRLLDGRTDLNGILPGLRPASEVIR